MAGMLKHELRIELQKRVPQRMTEAPEVSSPPDSGACTRIVMMGNGELKSHQVNFGPRLSSLQCVEQHSHCSVIQMLTSAALCMGAGRRKKSLGLYSSEEEAAQAYDRAALSLRCGSL